MNRTIHIVGLGAAGLSAAVRLAERGEKLVLYESAKVAGGRCRSFHDSRLDCLIDNGNHLLLSGNKSALSYLDLIGARHELAIGEEAHFPFVDLASDERWQVTMNKGKIPTWIFNPEARIPNVKFREYLSALKFPFAGTQATINDLTGTQGTLYGRFWEPMTWAVLNTTPDRASAQLMWHVFRETFAKGGEACRPMIAKRGLSETFINPAIQYLEHKGATFHFNEALRDLTFDKERVTNLNFSDREVALQPDDQLVLAVPRAVGTRLLPDTEGPDGDAAIVNAHFKLSEPLPADKAPPLLGLVNAKTHWIFTRDNIVSLTISAADALGLDRLSEEELLPQLWQEVCQALQLPQETPFEAGRLIRERRATFDQSPESVARRPSTGTKYTNMVLAGDWVDNGLPATIEGAIRSGEMAASALR